MTLFVGVAAAAGSTPADNLATFARPVLALLDQGHGSGWRLGCLLALQAVAGLWAFIQRAQIRGGGFMAFASSLPFSSRQLRRADIGVLLLADSPLLLALLNALLVAAARGAPAADLALLVAIGPLAMLVQFAALERRLFPPVAVAAACLLLALPEGGPARLATSLVLTCAGVAALLLGAGAGPRRRIQASVAAPRWPGRLFTALAGRRAPALRVPLAILYRERRDEVLAKALGGAAIVVGAWALLELFDDDHRSLPVILLAQGIVALHLSGLFRGLAMSHQASEGFTASLPLARGWRRAVDLAAILALALPLLLGLAALGAVHHAAGAARLLGGAASSAGLLAALRAPQLFSERHAVVLSAIVAGCWIAATIATLYQG